MHENKPFVMFTPLVWLRFARKGKYTLITRPEGNFTFSIVLRYCYNFSGSYLLFLLYIVCSVLNLKLSHACFIIFLSGYRHGPDRYTERPTLNTHPENKITFAYWQLWSVHLIYVTIWCYPSTACFRAVLRVQTHDMDSRLTSRWLGTKIFCIFVPNQEPLLTRPLETGLIGALTQGLLLSVIPFLPPIFFRPFSISLAPLTASKWASKLQERKIVYSSDQLLSVRAYTSTIALELKICLKSLGIAKYRRRVRVGKKAKERQFNTSRPILTRVYLRSSYYAKHSRSSPINRSVLPRVPFWKTYTIPTVFINNYSMSARWIWVGYNHLISNKREWNNCFIKFGTVVYLEIIAKFYWFLTLQNDWKLMWQKQQQLASHMACTVFVKLVEWKFESGAA